MVSKTVKTKKIPTSIKAACLLRTAGSCRQLVKGITDGKLHGYVHALTRGKLAFRPLALDTENSFTVQIEIVWLFVISGCKGSQKKPV